MELENFVKKRNVKLLILEHFDFQCEIPQVDEIVLSSTKPLHVKDFDNVLINLLDFEEFIAFERKNADAEQLFNIYANVGTYPSIVQGSEEAKYRNLQMMINSSHFSIASIEILKELANFQASKVSILQIYELLKYKIKLSKDTLYAEFEALRDNGLIYMLENFEKPKSSKKLYFVDFALKNALTFKKDFIKRFENIVFCELLKKEWDFYFTSNIDFYVPSENLAILCIPFLPPELIKRRFLKILKELNSLHVKELIVLSVGNEGRYKESGITCEILPFWEWALR
ncbi:MAG: ATP-binding protein [Campylobacteraceae bacterium]